MNGAKAAFPVWSGETTTYPWLARYSHIVQFWKRTPPLPWEKKTTGYGPRDRSGGTARLENSAWSKFGRSAGSTNQLKSPTMNSSQPFRKSRMCCTGTSSPVATAGYQISVRMRRSLRVATSQRVWSRNSRVMFPTGNGPMCVGSNSRRGGAAGPVSSSAASSSDAPDAPESLA